MDQKDPKLTLKSVKVIFANLEDEGFGRSITIDVTDEELRDKITAWVSANNIGKKENAGKPNFKEYEGKTQYSFKINDYTKFAGLKGLSEKELGFGAMVSLVAQAFEYDNKFGKGTSASLSAVLVEQGRTTGADADLADLLNEAGEQPTNEQLSATEKDIVIEDIDEDKPIDLKSIPF